MIKARMQEWTGATLRVRLHVISGMACVTAYRIHAFETKGSSFDDWMVALIVAELSRVAASEGIGWMVSTFDAVPSTHDQPKGQIAVLRFEFMHSSPPPSLFYFISRAIASLHPILMKPHLSRSCWARSSLALAEVSRMPASLHSSQTEGESSHLRNNHGQDHSTGSDGLPTSPRSGIGLLSTLPPPAGEGFDE